MLKLNKGEEMDIFNSIKDLKSKEKSKAFELYISKRNIRKLAKHSKKLNLTKSKFLDYFLQNINDESLNGLNTESVKTKKCVRVKRTVKISTYNKIKDFVQKENTNLTTLVNRLIEKHL